MLLGAGINSSFVLHDLPSHLASLHTAGMAECPLQPPARATGLGDSSCSVGKGKWAQLFSVPL